MVQQRDASCIELEPSAVEQRVVVRIGVRRGHVEVLEERAPSMLTTPAGTSLEDPTDKEIEM